MDGADRQPPGIPDPARAGHLGRDRAGNAQIPGPAPPGSARKTSRLRAGRCPVAVSPTIELAGRPAGGAVPPRHGTLGAVERSRLRPWTGVADGPRPDPGSPALRLPAGNPA